MFVGHYSAAFAAKALEPRVPLWVLLLAAQLVDVFWVVFVLTGVEHARLDPGLPSNPLDLTYMPFTHSLVATVGWAGAAGWIVARVPRLGGTVRAGVLVGLVVASHWGLDLLVHRPDLTLWGSPPKLGLGLWNAPLLAYALEIALLLASAALLAVRVGLSSRARRGLAAGIAALVLLQTGVALGPIPFSLPLLVGSIALLFGAVAGAGFWTERWACSGR